MLILLFIVAAFCLGGIVAVHSATKQVNLRDGHDGDYASRYFSDTRKKKLQDIEDVLRISATIMVTSAFLAVIYCIKLLFN